MANASWVFRGLSSPSLYGVCARVLAAALFLLGGMVLLGWFLRTPALTNIHHNWFSMNPLTAVSFCVIGTLLVLGVSARRRRWSDICALIGSVAVCMVGASALMRTMLDIDPGLDLIMFHSRLNDGVHPPSRLSHNTAQGFVVVGAALFLLRRRREDELIVIAMLAVASIVIGGLGISSYVIGIDPLLPIASLTVMAVHTAAGFVVAGLGVLVIVITRAVAARHPAYIQPRVPGRWSIASVQRVGSIGFAVALVFLAAIGIICTKSLSSLLIRSRLNRDSRQYVEQLLALDSAVQTFQSAGYRYLLEGSRGLEEEYTTAYAGVQTALQQLDPARSATADRSHFAERLDDIRELAQRHIEDLANFRHRLDTGEAKVGRLGTPAFDRSIKKIHGEIELLVNDEHVAIEHQRQTIQATMQLTEVVVSLGSITGLIAIAVAAWLLGRITSQLHRTQDEAAKLSLVACETENLVIITDATGRIEWVNDSFTRHTGYSLEDVKEKMPTQLLHVPLTEAAVAAQISGCIASGTAFSGEVVSYTKSAGPLYLAIDIHPVHNDRGNFVNLVWIERDITESRREQQSLSFLAAIVRSSDDAIVSESLDGTITSWNRGAEQLLGYRAEDVVGKPISILAPSDHADEIPSLLRRLRSGEHIAHFETVRKTVDGRRIDVSLTLSPIHDAEGRVIGFSKTARDITHRKQIEAELRQARAAAEAASQSKSAFLAHMSHEIRTPLNGVVGMIDLLMGTSPVLNEQQLTYGRIAKSSAEALTKIVNDILDFSKIEAGKLDIVPDDFRLHALTLGVVELMRHQADAKGVEMVCVIDPDVPDQVCADPDRIRQILINLVSNAIKFTKEGRVTVKLSPESRIGQRVTVRFEIIDTGIGISQERLDRLFRAFSQADTSTTRLYGGTGLGLVISRQLAELMGGSIGVESQLGRGSTFWFTIGLECRSQLQLPLPSLPIPITPITELFLPDANPESNRAHRILLVEDNSINQIVAREILIKSGFVCDIAENGQAAVEAVEKTPYALVLMDCEMPVMDGFEATRHIRDLERSHRLPRNPSNSAARLPIIALTANAMMADRQQCLDAGMDAYVSKPINAKSLIDVLHKFIVREPSLAAGSTAPPLAA